MKQSQELQQQGLVECWARHPIHMVAKGVMVADFQLVMGEYKAIVLKMPDDLVPQNDYWMGILHDLHLHNLELFDPEIYDDWSSERINKIASPALVVYNQGADWEVWYARYNRMNGNIMPVMWLTYDGKETPRCVQLYKELEGLLIAR